MEDPLAALLAPESAPDQPPLMHTPRQEVTAAIASLALGGAERIVLDGAASRVGRYHTRLIVLHDVESEWPPRAWWQFWKAPPLPSQSLSVDSPNLPQPPNDELSLLEALLQKSVRRVRDTATDRHDAFDRDSRHDTSSTSSSPDSFRGKGGESGGAGASGSWSDPAGKGLGVDDAGRIMGAAAAVGTLAAAAAVASDGGAPADAGAESSGGDAGTDTGTTTAY